MSEPIIYHIDVNSAFLSWEAERRHREHPEETDLRSIPSAIGGNEEMRHGIVLAKSPSAKKYGVRTGEPLAQARRKCPGLVVVPPNYPLYVEKSRKFIELLQRYAPSVEQYSIDEAFCDMSGTEKLYGNPVLFAHTLKDTIMQELGFTVNIGVSCNKLLAKMASDFEKPNQVHTLFPGEIPEKLWPLPIEELFFVGRATSAKLRSMGIATIDQLAATDVRILRSHFKKHGETIWNYANGRDTGEVTSKAPANKSYGNSLTIHFDVEDSATAKMVLLSLCETVGARIRADKSYIGVVSVSIVDFEFHHSSRQETLPSSTNVTEKIYESACRLFDRLWDGKPIRQLGVSAGHATTEHYMQYELFDSENSEKLSRLNSAIDSIRSRYGEDSIKRARFAASKDAPEQSAGFSHMTRGLDKSKRTGMTGKV
ncbi:MAG: DNA polymerase IV [Eubacteriales bacterium]|nr:DNA polymerase IV [Eubacteriales bacterium]